MPNPNTEQLNPPASWDEFEDICADLFAREWGDPNVIRYGRSGQRQHGVDIKGMENGAHVAAQCKNKAKWPPKKLAKSEIDAEVKEALKFRPKLTKYIITTTADDDATITDHVNAISERHARKGLFRVHVYTWPEIMRRVRSHPDLTEKHFDVYVLRQARDDIRALHRKVDRLQPVPTVQIESATRADPIPPRENQIQTGFTEALERDFARRYDTALKRSLYPELVGHDEFNPLAEDLLLNGASVSPHLKRTILLRAARAAALRGRLERSRTLLAGTQAIDGPPTDASARARLAVAEGTTDKAIQILRDLTDEDSRSTLISILAAARGDAFTLQWISEEQIRVSDLAPAGVLSFSQLYLRQGDFGKVRGILNEVTDGQLQEAPYFHFLRAAVGFAMLFAAPDRPAAITGTIPLELQALSPILEGHALGNALAPIEGDFRQALPLARALNLQQAPSIIEAYLTWCGLLDPARKETVLAKLKRDVSEPGAPSASIQLALAYDRTFDPAAVLAYLDRRAGMGGLTRDDLRALIAIRIHRAEPKAIAEAIAEHRELAELTFGGDLAAVLEIQGLARSGDVTSARIAYEKAESILEPELRAGMKAEIAKAEGADPVTEHLKLYEETKTTEALRLLLGALMAKNDHLATARYAEELYDKTEDPRALELAAKALIKAGDEDNFSRLYIAHPSLKEADPAFKRHRSWQLFRLGRMREAKELADEVARLGPDERDLNLEIAIALETGEWEQLAQPLATQLERADKLDGIHLIRAATLAQTSGQGPVLDLIEAALHRSKDDPHVLLGAYLLYVEEGLEDEKPQAQEWFNRALTLSGPEGPVQRFELKEILSKQLEWNEHTRTVTDRLTRGELPMILASEGLRTTVVDAILRNLIRNSELGDTRRRVAIPLFSGRRPPIATGEISVAAFDITSLLVLGWLGLIEKAFALYATIMLPASLMMELFEGRRRIRQTQRSRLKRAREIRQAVADGRLKVLSTKSMAKDDLTTTVGGELAALLREAVVSGGIVIRPAPVKRLGMDDADADLKTYQNQLGDMHALLKTLVEHNAIDESAETAAKAYFDLQDKGWPASAMPDPARPIYLDDLAVVYLQYTGLLGSVLRAFPSVYIHESADQDAAVLIEHDHHVSEVFQVIERVRAAVRTANADGKVVYGSRGAAPAEADDRDFQSTINLIADTANAEIAFFDDRFLNKEGFVSDQQGRSVRIATTLDLIEELRVRDLLSDSERRAARYRLRIGGAMLVPVDADEFVAAARRNQKHAAPEFRALQDELSLARVAEMPQFPGEMPWFISYVHSAKAAIMHIWNDEADAQRAASLSSAILTVYPSAEEWVSRWGQATPPEWIRAVNRALGTALCVPLEIADIEKAAAYNQWLEAELIGDIRANRPLLYDELIRYIREFAKTTHGKDDVDESQDGNYDDGVKPKLTAAQLAKLSTLYLLRRLSPPIQNDVLSDGSVAKFAKLQVAHPLNLKSGQTFERKVLFAALRKLADKKPTPTTMNSADGKAVKVNLSATGPDGVIRVGNFNIRIPFAALLTSSVTRRKSILDDCLKRYTLSRQNAGELRRLIGKRLLTDTDFITMGSILAASPESFSVELREQSLTGRLSKSDFLPQTTDHWDNLVPPPGGAQTLGEYIAGPLGDWQRALLAQDTDRGLDIASLALAAPEVLSVDMLSAIKDDPLLKAVNRILEIGDPFALAMAFAICIQRIASGKRFVQAGEGLLDRLFSDPPRLLRHFDTYGAAFIFATAFLAEHEVLRLRPVFWRRVAAATHAALVARTLGESSDKGEPLQGWALRVAGRAFYVSVMNDAAVEARWQPEWIDAMFLAADAYGRVAGASSGMASGAMPPSWQKKLAKAKTWMEAKRLLLASGYPAISQGALPLPPVDEKIGGPIYDDLIREPTSKNFLYLTPLVSAFGFQARARPAVLTVLHSLRTGTAPAADGRADRALILAAHIAAVAKDLELADLTAQVCLQRVAAHGEEQSLLAMVSIIVQCAAPGSNREQSSTLLAQRLENLAFVAAPGLLDELLELLRILSRIDAGLATQLGRAYATARLGRGPTA